MDRIIGELVLFPMFELILKPALESSFISLYDLWWPERPSRPRTAYGVWVHTIHLDQTQGVEVYDAALTEERRRKLLSAEQRAELFSTPLVAPTVFCKKRQRMVPVCSTKFDVEEAARPRLLPGAIPPARIDGPNPIELQQPDAAAPAWH
jgi:hypothetical protein